MKRFRFLCFSILTPLDQLHHSPKHKWRGLAQEPWWNWSFAAGLFHLGPCPQTFCYLPSWILSFSSSHDLKMTQIPFWFLSHCLFQGSDHLFTPFIFFISFPNMMALREHSCSSDVPLFFPHAEHRFVASDEVFSLFSPTEVQPLLVLCLNQTLTSSTSSKASRDCRQHQRKGFLSLVSDPDSLGRPQNSPEDKLQIKSCFTPDLSVSQLSEYIAVRIQQVPQGVWVRARHGSLQFMTWPG